MARARAVPYVDPEASLFVHAAVAIGTRLDEMIAFEYCLSDIAAVNEVHEMRIAAKRLRYTMDLFQSAFNDYSSYGAEFAAAISEIKLLQEHLGSIHDADVLAPKLADQLRKLVEAGHGKDRRGEPRVGVHLIDLDACQGLLTLLLQTRTARDASFEQLRSDWVRMRNDNVFEQWRKLLRKAITDETLATVLHETKQSEAPTHDNMLIAAVADIAQGAEGSNGKAADETQTDSRNGSAAGTRTRRKITDPNA